MRRRRWTEPDGCAKSEHHAARHPQHDCRPIHPAARHRAGRRLRADLPHAEPFRPGCREVIETYVYQAGVVNGNFSFSTAVGLMKGLIGLILIYGANKLAKRMGNAASSSTGCLHCCKCLHHRMPIMIPQSNRGGCNHAIQGEKNRIAPSGLFDGCRLADGLRRRRGTKESNADGGQSAGMKARSTASRP